MRITNSKFFDYIKILFVFIFNLYRFFYYKLKYHLSLYNKPNIITKNGYQYRDLYKNEKIEVYENKNSSPEHRANDLLSKMTIAEKVGQMFHPPIFINGGLVSEIMNLANSKGQSIESLIVNKHISHFNLYGSPSPLKIAKKINQLQRLAERTRLGIPLTISSDPIHEVPRGGGIASFSIEGFSKWPSQLGFASIRNSKIIREFAEIAREEYLAVGIRTALHPMCDLATEPRWARNFGTFGSNADLSSKLTIEYMNGFQGKKINKNSVLTMVKHFPGGGPQEDGFDPHLYTGRNQVYPGNNFEYHLQPFKEAINNNLKVIMPYYGIPIDQTSENVAMGFNSDILTKLLKKRLRYKGVICSDWGIITGRHWGVEDLSISNRYKKSIEAGMDQFGGEDTPDYVINLIKKGEISEKRIDDSVRKILINKFSLGLFEQPFVNESLVNNKVGIKYYKDKGLDAQRKSIILLENKKYKNNPILPIKKKTRVFLDDFDEKDFTKYCQITNDPKKADYIIVQLRTVFNGNQAPGVNRPLDNFLSKMLPNNDLNYDENIISKLKIYSSLSKLIVVVDLNRPAILTEIQKFSYGLIGVFGVFDKIVAEVIFGVFNPTGKLPFDLPSSTEELLNQKSDIPDDTKNPIYSYGYGLNYSL